MQRSTELVVSPSYSGGPATPQYVRQELTIQDLLGVLSRRRRAILITMGVVMLIAALLCLSATRLYQATAEVQVEKDSVDALSLDNMMGQNGAAADAVEANMNMQTQAQILQSDSLALQVVQELNLENTPDFKSRFNPIGWVLGLFAPKGVADPKGVPLEDAPGRRAHVVKAFQAHLKVQPIAGSRLIKITYYSQNPQTAALVVNRLVQDLTNYNYQTRHDATHEAGTWLEGQLNELRKQSEDLQSQVVDLQRDSGVFTLGQTDNQGREQVYAPTMDRLQQATTELGQAQSARIVKGALYEVVKTGDPELISGIAGNGMLAGAMSGVNGSLTLLQNLRGQEAQAQAQLNEMSSKFGPNYPKLAELQANLASIQANIHAEANRIAARVKNDYMVAQQVENNDRAVFEAERKQAESINDRTVEYQIKRQEATQTRNLYEDLRRRMSEANLVAGMHSTNIAMVDPARPTAHPAKPNVLIYAAGSIAGGLFLGICMAVFREATDRTIQGPEELQALCGSAPVGFLPMHDSKREALRLKGDRTPYAGLQLVSQSASRQEATNAANSLAASMLPHSPYTESLRALRTSLMQSNHGGVPPQVILVTSSVPGEGKSMLSANLAIIYAQRGKKVLLVDGDLRTPVLDTRLNLTTNGTGLSTLLSEEPDAAMPIPRPIPLEGVANVFVMPSGPIPHYPAELLSSDRMSDAIRSWRKEFDYIVIDGAPILPVTDSVILSRHVDFTLLVGRHSVTDRRSIQRSMQLLRGQGTKAIGVVLNGVKLSGDAHYQYYGYKHAAAYYRSESHA